MTQFTKLSLAVEHEGKPYFVYVPKECWQILLNLASGFTDNTLKLTPAPEGSRFEELNNKKGQS